MFYLLPLIILIILGCVYAGSLKSSSSKLRVVVCMLLLILFLCYLQMNTKEMFSGYSGYSPLDYKLTNGSKNGCDKFNYSNINSQIGSTGTYDGIKLKSTIVSKPLVDPITIFSPVGDGIKLTQQSGETTLWAKVKRCLAVAVAREKEALERKQLLWKMLIL